MELDIPSEVVFPSEVLHTLLSFLPEPRAAELTILSNRRNKGCLRSDGKSSVFRTVNLCFSNSGVNDGLSSALIREAAILRGPLRDHPHIVSLRSARSANLGDSVVEFRYSHFPRSLREVLVGPQRLSIEVTRDMSHQLFRALAFVHSKGVVHRNLKPENILICGQADVVNNFTLVLADFAHARILDGLDLARQPLTPEEVRNRDQTEKERARLAYKAPELLLRLRSYGACVDMWAAGVILAELLLKPSPLPWGSASSETETLVRLSLIFGSPKSEDLDLACHFLFPIPLFPQPDIRHAGGFWEHVRTAGGQDALVLLARLMDMDPQSRVTARQCLSSPFVLGSAAGLDWTGTGDVNMRVFENLEIASKITTTIPPQWIQWLFSVARLLECQTSLPVHRAVRFLGACKLHARPGLLVAALKLAARFEASRDMFKQGHCAEVSAATNRAIADLDIVAAELELLPQLDRLVCLTSIGCLRKMAPGPPNQLVAEFICDLALMDPGMAEFADSTIALVALLTASQWTGVPVSSDLSSTSTLEESQMALAKCVALVSLDRGHAGRDSWYKLNGKSVLPPAIPSRWQTSRSYLKSVTQTPPTPAQTPTRRTVFRSSTLEHAQAWALQSRRRSRRSRSVSTPVPFSSKRMRVQTPSTPVANAKGSDPPS